IAVAAVTHTLPNWPPGQADIHVADQTGTPIFTLAGAGNISSGGPITIWNDVSVSNSIFTAWIVMALLVVLSILATARLSEHPGRLQNLFELVVQGLADFMREAGGSGVVRFLVGIIELFSELFRILTLTLRLWGNIWGGEIVLSVLAALLFIPSLSLPFIGLELFIGFIQAFVFAFLVLLYIILALESH